MQRFEFGIWLSRLTPALSKGEGVKKITTLLFKVLSFGLLCVHIFSVILMKRPTFKNVIEFSQALL